MGKCEAPETRHKRSRWYLKIREGAEGQAAQGLWSPERGRSCRTTALGKIPTSAVLLQLYLLTAAGLAEFSRIRWLSVAEMPQPPVLESRFQGMSVRRPRGKGPACMSWRSPVLTEGWEHVSLEPADCTLPQFPLALAKDAQSDTATDSHCHPSTQMPGPGHKVSRCLRICNLPSGNLCPGSPWASIPGSGKAPPSVWEGSSRLFLLCLYSSKCAKSNPGDFTICQIKWCCLIYITPRWN